MTIHLIGVAGSGMSGLASLLLALGHRVTGSDRVTTDEVDRLQQLGLVFSMPQQAEDAADADLIIYSSAIHPGNATFDEAKRLGKKMVRRAEALAALMTGKKGILVCGMHGKTTTASMLAHVLHEGKINPSHYVGAEIPILGTNARWNSEGDYFVAEGDESDGTLVHYTPEHAIVLNIEPEHLDFYKNLEAIDAVYHRLVRQTKGKVFYWAEDPGAVRVCEQYSHAIAVGTREHCIYHYENLRQEKYHSTFDVIKKNQDGSLTRFGSLKLTIPGVHNVHNALLVIAQALELGLSFKNIATALQKFCGAKRRFELKYENKDIVLVDDYGHHPTEIAATLATARLLLQERGLGRLLVMFQPHRYSRTLAFQKEFGTALLQADIVFVTEIYPASEEPLSGVTGKNIVEAAEAQGHTAIFYEPCLDGLRMKLAALMKPGDIILSLGAGNIHEEATRFVADLKKRDQLLSVMREKGRVQLYEPLTRHTTMRVGGPAQFWVEPETVEGFAALVQFAHQEKIPLMVLGRGSNLIVRDGGIPGIVAHLVRGSFAQYRVEESVITAGVGVKMKQLSNAARQAGLSGFEWMEGIPGNLGGGVRMNAGAMGRQTFDQVIEIHYVDAQGTLGSCTPQELEIHYRNVPFFKNHYVVSASLKGHPESLEKIEELMKSSWTHRRSTQPIAASAGCIFKNPTPSLAAGRLIEELGLKNNSIGRARISDIHANFIVNDGGATASEILELIQKVKETAFQRRGISLETEVQIVGLGRPLA